MNYEIQVAQHKAYMKKVIKKVKVYLVTQRQKLVACGTQAPLEHSPDIIHHQMNSWDLLIGGLLLHHQFYHMLSCCLL